MTPKLTGVVVHDLQARNSDFQLFRSEGRLDDRVKALLQDIAGQLPFPVV